MPYLTTYTQTNTTTFQATGIGSTLSLPALATLGNMSGGRWTIEATAGGTLNLSGLTTADVPNAPVSVNVDGAASQIILSALTSFICQDYLADFEVTNGTSLNLPVLAQGRIRLAEGTSVAIQGTLVTPPAPGTVGATINLPASSGLTVLLPNTGTLTDTTVNVGGGSTLAWSGGGSFAGTTTLIVAQGGAVDLTGGQNTTYSGTLTGSGAGTVKLSGNWVRTGCRGADVELSRQHVPMDERGLLLRLGDVTNRGIMNLAGGDTKGIYSNGMLQNFGTIIQSGAGNLWMHGDGTFANKLVNEAGAVYEIVSDADISYDAAFRNPQCRRDPQDRRDRRVAPVRRLA